MAINENLIVFVTKINNTAYINYFVYPFCPSDFIVYPKQNKEANILLIEGIKNGKPGIKILPPIISHNEDGSYSDKIKIFFS